MTVNKAAVADLVFYLHMAMIVALLGGVLLLVKFPAYKPWHCAFVCCVVGSQLLCGGCPLTVLEVWLRDGRTAYTFTGSLLARVGVTGNTFCIALIFWLVVILPIVYLELAKLFKAATA